MPGLQSAMTRSLGKAGNSCPSRDLFLQICLVKDVGYRLTRDQ